MWARYEIACQHGCPPKGEKKRRQAKVNLTRLPGSFQEENKKSENNMWTLVPTLRVGTHVGTLCVPNERLQDICREQAATQSVAPLRSHAERGNESGIACGQTFLLPF